MIFVQANGHRVGIPSLRTFLRRSLTQGPRMNAAMMLPQDAARCRWVGYGIGKGVTDPTADVTVFAVPTGPGHGLHGELIQGFPCVDPTPACYDDDHALGFGDFVRWVHFADPQGGPGVIGVDFSLVERPTAGVATDMLCVARVAAVLRASDIPEDAELALLDWRMCEPEELADWRGRMGLATLADWASAAARFHPDSGTCPRCGLHMAPAWAPFCPQCGCRPELVWHRNGIATTRARSVRTQEVHDGMEDGLAGLRWQHRAVPPTAYAA